MTHRRATLALLLVTVLWGVAIVAIKAMFRDVSPLLGVGIRFAISALILAPLLPGLTRREAEAGIVIGLLFAAGVALQNVGLEITTASRSVFIVAISALLTPAFAAVLFGDRVGTGLMIRIVAALGGVYLLTAPDGSLSSINRGDWLTLISALLFAGQIVAVGRYALGTSIARVLSIKFAITSLVGWGGAATIETARITVTPFLGLLVFYLVATSITTFALQLRAQRVVTASEAALIFLFEPVVAAGVSYFAFDERLAAVQLLGGLVILAAVGAGGLRPKGLTARGLRAEG